MQVTSSFSTRESALVAAARAGDASGLIEHLYQTCLPASARKLAESFRTMDAEDILHQGIEWALRILQRGLEARNPVAFLVHSCQMKMISYCREQRCAIRVPSGSQSGGVKVPDVLSLDAPLTEDDLTLYDVLETPAPVAHDERTESRVQALYAALRRLPLEEQQYFRGVHQLNAYQPVPLPSDYVSQVPRERKNLSASGYKHLRRDALLEAAL